MAGICTVPVRPGMSIVAMAMAIAAVPAAAQTPAADPSAKVIARACAGYPNKVITQAKLATALLEEIGVYQPDFASDLPPIAPRELGKAMALRIGKMRTGELQLPDYSVVILTNTDLLEGAIIATEKTAKPKIKFEDGQGLKRMGLFSSDGIERTLVCGPAEPTPSLVESWEKQDSTFAIALRGTPEQLPLIDDDRKGTDGLAFLYERTRSKLDDGTKKTDTTIKLSGTLGFRITGPQDPDTVYLYGRYELSKQRTRPAPVLTPPATESDGDTDTLETGVTVRTELLGNNSQSKLFVSGSGGMVFDFAKDAQRLHAKLLFTPAVPAKLFNPGVCGLGSYNDFIGALKARCNLQIEVLGAAVLKRGALKPGDYDSFLLIGGRASFELFAKVGKSMAVVAGVNYRLLPIIASGDVKKIERIDATVKYRFWTPQNVGIDVGFSYKKGTNEVSLKKEDILSFGLGVIY